MTKAASLILGGYVLAAMKAAAVIVAGTSGTGNNNNTQSGLDAHLAGTAQSPFPFWNNLVRVSDASGVYLGYNPTTMNGWVLSANHVSPPTNITVAGSNYSVISGTQINNSDLKLYQISGAPNLSPVSLSAMAATVGESALMFGRGFTNDTTAPFSWQTPGTNDINGMRWATNLVETTGIVDIGGGNLQPYILTDFDGPLGVGTTAFDGQGANGDSGGGLFINRAGIWQLAGIAHFVDSSDAVEDPAEFGDRTAYSDVAAHLASIQATTGILIPEPSVALLLALAPWVTLRRKRN